MQIRSYSTHSISFFNTYMISNQQTLKNNQITSCKQNMLSYRNCRKGVINLKKAYSTIIFLARENRTESSSIQLIRIQNPFLVSTEMELPEALCYEINAHIYLNFPLWPAGFPRRFQILLDYIFARI